jgi:hypothetical protein
VRFFYIAVAETRRDMLEAIIETIGEWDERARKRDIRVGVLVRYTKWRGRPCLPCRLAGDRGLPVFIDNGAFSFLTASDLEAWPRLQVLDYWLRDYAEWLRRHAGEYDYAALSDLPVHGREFLPAPKRQARIALSTHLQARLLSTLPGEVRRRMVPVIQGYAEREYVDSFRQLERAGVLEESAYSSSGGYAGVVAVGSVCVRKWSAAGKTGILAGGEAAGTLREFLKSFLDLCCHPARGFHLFGLHAEATRYYGSHPRFFAADTGAHGLNYRYKWRTVLGCQAPNTSNCAAKAVDRQLQRTLEPLLTRSILEYAG